MVRGWLKLTCPLGLQVAYALQLTVSKIWVERCVPGSAGQLQTASVRGYCSCARGFFRRWLVSSGTEPAITKKVCDRSLSNSFKRPATAFGKVLGKALVCVLPCFLKDHLLTMLQDEELTLHSPSAIFSMLSDSKKCPWHVVLFPKSEVGQERSLVYPHACGLRGLRALLPLFPSSGGSCLGMLSFLRRASNTRIWLISSKSRAVISGCPWRCKRVVAQSLGRVDLCVLIRLLSS